MSDKNEQQSSHSTPTSEMDALEFVERHCNFFADDD